VSERIDMPLNMDRSQCDRGGRVQNLGFAHTSKVKTTKYISEQYWCHLCTCTAMLECENCGDQLWRPET